MAVLPSEDSVGQLDTTPSRRTGVATWDNSSITKGYSTLGQGLQSAGNDVAAVALKEKAAQDELALAKANAQVQVSTINLDADVARTTDPSQLTDTPQKYQSAVEDAAKNLPEGRLREKFLLGHQPTVAAATVGIDTKAYGLQRDQYLAGMMQDMDNLRTVALLEPDPSKRAEFVKTHVQPYLDKAVKAGYMTPQVAQKYGQEWGQNYAETWVKMQSPEEQLKLLGGATDPATVASKFIGAHEVRDKGVLQDVFRKTGGQAIDPSKVPWCAAYVDGILGLSGKQQAHTLRAADFLKYGAPTAAPTRGDVVVFKPQAAGSSGHVGFVIGVEGDKVRYIAGNDNNQVSESTLPLSQVAGFRVPPPAGTPIPGLNLNAPRVRETTKAMGFPEVAAPAAPASTEDIFKRNAPFVMPAESPGRSRDDLGLSESPYNTKLSEAEETAFKTWVKDNKVPFNPEAKTSDYDMRGFWKALQSGDPKAKSAVNQNDDQIHYPDYWKTPYHESFSNESKWANPDTAPKWNDKDQLVAPDGKVIHDERAIAAAGAPPIPGTTTLALPPSGIAAALPPDKRLSMLQQAQRQVDAAQKAQAQNEKLETKAAVETMGSAMSEMVSGRQMPEAAFQQMQQAYGNSPNPDVRQQFTTMRVVRNILQEYRGRSVAEIAADVTQQNAAYERARQNPNDPSLGLRAAALNASQDYLKTLQTEIVKDPLGRAAKDGVLPNGVLPIDPNDPKIADALRSRATDAQHVADFYKQSPKYLLPQEKIALKQLAGAGGKPMVDLASNIVSALGTQAGAVFKEIGGDAPAFTGVGQLQLLGGDPEAINDIARYTAAANDKNASKDLPRFNEGIIRSNALTDPLKDAASGLGPVGSAQIRATANMLMGARAAREGTDPKIDRTVYRQEFVDKAYNLALGANYYDEDKHYGGVTNHGSSWGGPSEQTVLVPSNMKADMFSRAIGSITADDLKALPQEAMTAGGKPITVQQIKDGHMIPVPDKRDGLFHGRYTITMNDPNGPDPRPIYDKDGRPYVLDMTRLEPRFRTRFPGIYMDAPKPPDFPPYRSTPGMIAPDGAEPTPDGM